ncbi:hypothetical protein IAU60_003410 [Kwoniella sp. DSM 27419]
MASARDIDSLFHRAVDIVQSLPKGGPVQTSYEEKLWLYSLYKQATEGDISIPRPGMLDILGKAKWDHWNKQKGIDKGEAKKSYVNALLSILKKHSEIDSVQAHLGELESFGAGIIQPARPASPASSTSSYHSSQASPPPSPPPPRPAHMLPPDPLLPPPDVSEDFVPPSALNASHRSLLNLSQQQISTPPVDPTYGGIPVAPPRSNAQASRAHSLVGGQGDYRPSGGSVHSFRQRPYLTEQPRNHNRPYDPQIPAVRDFAGIGPRTPDQSHLSPYLGLHAPTPVYPPRPGSASTYSHVPPPVNLAHTLQQIQTSLTALHERLSTLERAQSMLLRREEKRKAWFWTSREEDELDQMEYNDRRDRTPADQYSGSTTVTRLKRRQGKLSARVLWFLLGAMKRVFVDVGISTMVLLVGLIVLGGGWRKARWTLYRLRARFQRFLAE